MESSRRDHVPSDRKRVLEEIVRGRGFAVKLAKTLAGRSKNGNSPILDGGLTQQDLLEKLLRSFNDALSMLRPEEFEEVSDQAVVDRPRKRGKMNTSDDSEGSVWSSMAAPSDRRGCYKRRFKGETWTKFAPTMIIDDYQWRKYGQKSINKAAHPRSYFRCTHKAEKGCLATKQVQKISEDPEMYSTVYQGHHTCTDGRPLKSPEIVFDGAGEVPGNGNRQFFLRFDCNHAIGDLVKNEEIHPASSGDDYPGIYGPKGDNSNLYSDHGDIESSSHHGSFMDMVADSDELSRFIVDFPGNMD